MGDPTATGSLTYLGRALGTVAAPVSHGIPNVSPV